MRRFAVAAVAAVALAGCATTRGLPDYSATDRAAYVTMAASSDLYEIRSSELAQTRAVREDVRQFARLLIEDHERALQQVSAAAAASGYTPPPPTLMPIHVEMLDELRGLPPVDFDRVYMTQQVPAHEMALRLHQTYARRGDTPALRAAAESIAQMVYRHLRQARAMTNQ